MREIWVFDVVEKVKEALIEMNIRSDDLLRQQMLNALVVEESEAGKEMLTQVLENYVVAEERRLPLCQDTGMVMAEVRIGNEVLIRGGSLREALDEGIRRAYREGFFRKSIISDPFFGRNTQDNTPGVYFFTLEEGDHLEIDLLVKGGGCDNITTLGMLDPGSTPDDVERFLLRELDKKASLACPPLVVGVGIGGNGAYALFLASRALSRPLGSSHPDPRYRELEKKWCEDINRLGIGPQGVGGRVTCLEVRIETYPCHIASFPVGIACSCHVFRRKTLRW
ncbi:MAG: fumarate hydratase [Candidatus Caldatribacterium sp.]|nr:fumarate hydratase [Candidatus Caldatribacterium sp.]